MRLNSRSKITSFALKTLYSAVASAVFLSSSAYAAGLGRLTVLSSLGQPLNAEIELTAVTADQASGLIAKLAPAEAFRQANIDFNPALLSLRFAVEQRGSRQYIKVTSSQPVNEPFVDMLLELSWGTGRLVREYTFLLDPADMRSTQTAQVAPAARAAAGGASVTRLTPAPSASTPPSQAATRPAQTQTQTQTPTQTQTQTQTPTQTQTQTPQRTQAADAGEGASRYKVKAGDTLGRIAAQLKPVEVSLDMMLVALYRANPDAFAGNNMNRLKSGQILTVPDSGAIKGAGNADARGVVVAHAADFNAYRNKLAGQVVSAAPDKAPAASQSAGGKITAQVEERRTPVNESKDQLKLTKATAATDAGKTANTEERIAREKALAEATARVKELERNVSELEKLMVIKNKAAADAQQAQAAVVPAVAARVAPPVVTPAPAAATPATPAVVATPAGSSATPATVATLAKPADAPLAADPANTPAAKPADKVAVLKNSSEAPAAPGIVDLILDNAMLLLAALLALVALIGGAMFMKNRSKRDPSTSSEPSILGAPTDQAHSLFAETGGQSVDTSNSVFNSSFAPSASQLDTNEVDPVAEADVYIAYGRDAQAEEILKEALRTHPERYPVRLKLLEIYAARKDLRAYETQATDLYGQTKGQGDEWAQAAALGLAIDPANPLYANATNAAIAANAANAGPATIIPLAVAAPVLLDKRETPVILDGAPASLDSSALETAVPAPSAKLADEHTLDFDLGGLSFEPAAQASSAAVAANIDTNSMDFSMPGAVTPVAQSAAPAEEPLDMAFNMDFDTPAEAGATNTSAQHAQALEDVSLDLASNDLSAEYAANGKDDLSGMGDLANSFNIPQAPAAHYAPADTALEFSSMDLDLPGTSAAPKAPAFDISGIDLDLPEVGGADLSAAHMEMETKLDLAIAYQEIGDKDGARELLDEVIKGGSSEQVGKANEMRAKLA